MALKKSFKTIQQWSEALAPLAACLQLCNRYTVASHLRRAAHNSRRMQDCAVRLDEAAQRLADGLITEMRTSTVLTSHPLFHQLTAWLDEEGRMGDCVCNENTWVHAPTLDDVIECARNRFEGPDTKAAILTHIESVLVEALEGLPEYWGYEYVVPIVAQIEHSNGRTVYILYNLIDYLSGPFEWIGVFRDWDAISSFLREEGRILTLEEYRSLPQTEVLEVWGSHY